MNIGLTFEYVFLLLILLTNEFGESKLILSREEYRKIERQIKLQKKFTVRTIHTRHGDIYDCIDIYKQPAFDHPALSKINHTINFQNFQDKQSMSHEKARNNVSSIQSPKLGLNGGGCPIGTVPIRRLTKEDLVRATFASKARTFPTATKPASTHYARCSTADDDTGYSGVAASLAIYNPVVNSQQYSAARIKVQIGPDSIEAGWRVDPQLYADNNTRLYIHTDIRDNHCFNTLCPGFVITDTSIPLDLVLPTSTRGGEIKGIHISIISEEPYQGGGWALRVGTSNTKIGYWPDRLFVKPGAADFVEWGGETFGAENMGNPGLGSSNILAKDTTKDAFFSSVQVIIGGDVQSPLVDPVNVQCNTDTHVYDVKDEGNVGGEFQYLIFYGGIPCYTC